MAWTNITKPAVGDPTKKQAFADAVVDDLNHLKVGVDTLIGIAGVRNGSFENDSDSDGIPDNWTRTLYTGGTFALETTAPQHGSQAIKFTRASGGGNGGGYLTMEDYAECSPTKPVFVQWQHKCSAAGLKDRVELLWYQKDKTASATPSTTIYNSTANPTSWAVQFSGAMPPSDARFCRVRITGGYTDTDVAGDSFWDDVVILLSVPGFAWAKEYTAGSYTWRCPDGVTLVKLSGTGGGGGGANPTGLGGGGGGAAASGTVLRTVVPGTTYNIVVGAGGAGGADAADGANGAATTFDGVTLFPGGSGGVSQTGGAFGTMTEINGVVHPGTAGTNGGANDGGAGGRSHHGIGGAGGTTSPGDNDGKVGTAYGAGGGGASSNTSNTGGNGVGGFLRLEW